MNKSFFLLTIYFYLLISIVSINELISKDAHIDLLNKLNENFPAEIYFNQIDNQNNLSKGWMIIGKKGLARVEFEPPNHFIMVADGKWLIVHDAQYDRTSYLPLDGGILGALLYPEKFNEKNQLDVIKNNNNLYYSLVSENFEDTELRVFFDQDYKQLKGWNIIENKNISIKIKILKITKIQNLKKMDKNIFKFPEFMRANEKGFLGPYERTIKKIPTSKTN
jgi:outer membrane lipoprotein-sorting protein